MGTPVSLLLSSHLSAPEDLAALDKLLASQSYLGGGPSATKEDIAKWKEIGKTD